ncbi:Protein EXORDIUM [Rhynchospora pubera]|uniref:Protein EXORDIUM n=1 Tax=Rhynchospora pubera TaxID=906938 RepID=A0AAV8FYE4_9POAL|nr:Protein EXORDIUM [Rhynchospora pubera]
MHSIPLLQNSTFFNVPYLLPLPESPKLVVPSPTEEGKQEVKTETMSFLAPPKSLFSLVLFLSLMKLSLASLYQPPPTVLTYHNGHLLQGHIPISLFWYGSFTLKQKTVITDFILSLTPHHPNSAYPTLSPTVAKWWHTVDYYVQTAGRTKTHILLTNQLNDESYSLGKLLTRSQLSSLATRLGVLPGGIAVVLTSADVAVEGFCTNTCGLHTPEYIWVGDSSVQCAGKCAWPFHAAEFYGPSRGVVVRPPNGDAGLDGMVINLATLLAGVVTNPNGDGYFQGDAAAPVEVAAACPGVYGRGAYPGNPGQLKVDRVTGGSYNVEGRNGRKFLVPALVDPFRHSCQILS